jgi:putative transposase
MSYDPAIHHRRSIRLKGHDYAGGGVYFVTICAHREFVAWARGKPFGALGVPCVAQEGAPCVAQEGAPCVAPVQIIAEEWRRCGEIRNDVFPGECVVMPDHFHGLIRIEKGQSELGHVIGAFKAAASRRIRRGDTHVAPIRIWHRNYYETIVRTPEAERRIAEYIRMNPWRCVQELGGGLRGIGNPALWNGEKLGVLCSRHAPKLGRLPEAEVYFSGWHSPKEKEILDWLLKNSRRVIACPAWGIENSAFAPGVRDALEDNRMLILEMRDISGNLAAAEARNRFVMEHADAMFTPHVTPGGMLDRLLKEQK